MRDAQRATISTESLAATQGNELADHLADSSAVGKPGPWNGGQHDHSGESMARGVDATDYQRQTDTTTDDSQHR